MIMSLAVILKFQAKRLMISGYWTKDLLTWERDSVFVLTGKERGLWTPFRVTWMRYGRGDSLQN